MMKWNGTDWVEDDALPQSSALTGPNTVPEYNTNLVGPGEFKAPYSEEQMRNPRRQFWANMLLDMGNVFGSWDGSSFNRPFTGMGFKAQNQAMTANERMRAANHRARQQHMQQQNQYAMGLPKLQAAQLGLQQQVDADAMGQNPNLPDTYNQYQLAVQGGYEGSYNDWLQQQMRMKNFTAAPSNWREWLHYSQLSPEEQDAYLTMKRANPALDYAGQPVVRGPATGNATVVTPSGDQPFTSGNVAASAVEEGSIEGAAAGAQATEETWAAQAQQVRQQAQNIPQMREQIASVTELASRLDAGLWGQRTGPLEGHLARFNNPETAVMELQSVNNALKLLKDAGLTPVSDREFQTLQKLWADPFSDPKANAAKMKEIARKLQKELDELIRREKHVLEFGDLRRYGGSGGGSGDGSGGGESDYDIDGVTWE